MQLQAASGSPGCPIANPTAHLAEARINLQLQSPQTTGKRDNIATSSARLSLSFSLFHSASFAFTPCRLPLSRSTSRCSDEPQPLDSELHARRCCRETSRLDQRCDSQSRGLPLHRLSLLAFDRAATAQPPPPVSPSKRPPLLSSAPPIMDGQPQPQPKPALYTHLSQLSSLPLRTANSTPTASPGLFSPVARHPHMPTQSFSESNTPAPLFDSPYLHPLQTHRVREYVLTRISSLFPFLLPSPCLVLWLVWLFNATYDP